MDLKKLLFFIEIPDGSDVKYEVDEDTGMLMADRFLYTSMGYPANYGYVIGTKGKDGDPVDVLVLSSKKLVPGCGIKGHVIGMLEMEDEEGIDHKLIAVPDKKVDPVYGVYEDLKDVPQYILDRIKHFFEHYKELEPGKWIKVHKFADRKAAEKEIEESAAKFAEESAEDGCCGDGDCKCK
ncbi:inorganic diphosphatase [Candidatus Woesebacteria bacterium]|nr:inorganic diphosphatase [Candidatus Woesebacteria bacterium]